VCGADRQKIDAGSRGSGRYGNGVYALADKGFANKNEWHGDKVGDE